MNEYYNETPIRPKRIDEDYKREVAAMASQPNVTAGKVARQFGVSRWSVTRWKKEFGQVEIGAKTGGERKVKAAKGPVDPNGGATEIRQLNQKVTKLEMQADILKKAIAIFTQSPR